MTIKTETKLIFSIYDSSDEIIVDVEEMNKGMTLTLGVNEKDILFPLGHMLCMNYPMRHEEWKKLQQAMLDKKAIYWRLEGLSGKLYDWNKLTGDE